MALGATNWAVMQDPADFAMLRRVALEEQPTRAHRNGVERRATSPIGSSTAATPASVK